jgi:hypothetical protein
MWRRDTKAIDVIGGVTAALVLISEGWFGVETLKYTLLYLGAFAIGSAVCLWTNRVRTLAGWVFIAIFGAAGCTAIQEYFLSQALRNEEPMVLFEGMWILNLIFKISTSLVVVGVIHYAGILLREAVRKLSARHEGAT